MFSDFGRNHKCNIPNMERKTDKTLIKTLMNVC